MNLKIVAAFLILMSCTNSEAIENSTSKTIRYSEITNQLIEAETLYDASIILNRYDTHDQAVLCEHLLRKQNLWVIEHGLLDKVILKYGTNEFVKYVGSVLSAGSLVISAFTIYIALQKNFKWSKNVKDGVVFAGFSAFCALGAFFGHNENKVLKKQINEFHRIKELIAYIG